ncbi:MAG TPA: methyltransferase domain-containing protein [Arenimonas sp.]|nr:methyltransferase domain-containing protein [Arenimonas sp.]
MSDEAAVAARERAYQAFENGDLESAYSALADLYRQQGGIDAQTANDLAVVLFRLGRWQDAVEKFREAQRLSGDEGNLLVDNLIDALGGMAEAMGGVAGNGDLPALACAGRRSPYDPLARWFADSASALHRELRGLSDRDWTKALYGSLVGQPCNGHYLPGFIDEERQRIFVGSSGIAALLEAEQFIRVLLQKVDEHGTQLDERSVVVDFGSGWGRYTRFMLKYVHPDNLYGLEVSGGMVEHCRKVFGMANFLKVDSWPPSPLRSGMVDLAFGYSVFSHLSPDCADAWIGEFARIVRPGGLVLMTTQRRAFIDFCQNIRTRGDRSNPWYVQLAESFTDVEQCYADYDRGEFLHAGHGQYDGTYGESLIPRGYIERHWGGEFELVEFIDDHRILPQALFVLRRRG